MANIFKAKTLLGRTGVFSHEVIAPNLVYNTGNQTIYGNKTFANDIEVQGTGIFNSVDLSNISEFQFSGTNIDLIDSNVYVSGAGWIYISGHPVVTGSSALSLLNLNNVVYTTGNQTINGVKDFNNVINVSGIQFDILTTNDIPTHQEGLLYYSDDDKTLNLDTDVTDLSLPIGQENWVRAKNLTNSTLSAGTVVYISGAQGNTPLVRKSIATSDGESARTLGVAAHSITNNSKGYFTTFGLVEGIDTSAYSVGQTLYLSWETSGAFTGVKPQAPNHMVRIGNVIDQGNNGSIFVTIQNGFEIDELHDVRITNPQNKDGIIYNSASGLWLNTPAALANEVVYITGNQTIYGDKSFYSDTKTLVSGNFEIIPTYNLNGDPESLVDINSKNLFIDSQNIAFADDITTGLKKIISYIPGPNISLYDNDPDSILAAPSFDVYSSKFENGIEKVSSYGNNISLKSGSVRVFNHGEINLRYGKISWNPTFGLITVPSVGPASTTNLYPTDAFSLKSDMYAFYVNSGSGFFKELYADNLVYNTGDQIISGFKTFTTGIDIHNNQSPQSIRIFNRTGTNSGEFGLFGWRNNELIVGTQNSTSGILRNLVLTGQNVRVIPNQIFEVTNIDSLFLSGVVINISGNSSINIYGSRPYVNGTGVLLSGEAAGVGGGVSGPVVMQTGNQNIGGNKTFTGIVTFSGQEVNLIDSALNLSGAGNMTFTSTNIDFLNSPVFISGTNLRISGGIIANSLDLNGGQFVNYAPQFIDERSNFIISGNDNGRIILANSANQITGTIVSGNVTGFNTTIIQIGAGKIFITGSGINAAIPILSYNNQYKTAGAGATISLLHTGNNRYIMYGNTI